MVRRCGGVHLRVLGGVAMKSEDKFYGMDPEQFRKFATHPVVQINVVQDSVTFTFDDCEVISLPSDCFNVVRTGFARLFRHSTVPTEETGLIVMTHTGRRVAGMMKRKPVSRRKEKEVPEDTVEKKTVSVQDFCTTYGIGRGTWYNMVKRGEAPKHWSVGRRVMILKSDVEKWEKKLREKS